MKRFHAMMLVVLCLCFAGCATMEPAPFPSPEEIAQAYYGEYPENYEQIISRASEFNNYWSPVFQYNDVPKKMMIEWMGQYEYGWGGFFDVWLEDRKRVNMSKVAYRYLLRDGQIVILDRVNKFGLY